MKSKMLIISFVMLSIVFLVISYAGSNDLPDNSESIDNKKSIGTKEKQEVQRINANVEENDYDTNIKNKLVTETKLLTLVENSNYDNEFRETTIWKNKVWFIKHQTIYSYDLESNQVSKIAIVGKDQNSVYYDNIVISEDNIWFYGYKAVIDKNGVEDEYSQTGLAKYNIDTGEFREYNLDEIETSSIDVVYLFNNKILMRLTNEYGSYVYSLDAETNSLIKIENIYLPDSNEIVTYKNLLYLGTYDKGIQVVNSDLTVSYINMDTGLLSNRVDSLFLVKDSLWIQYDSTSDTYISKYDIKTKEFQHYYFDNFTRLDLIMSEDKNLWVIDDNTTLYKIKENTGIENWFSYKRNDIDKESFSVPKINDIYECDEYLLIALWDGLILINKYTGEETKYLNSHEIKEEVLNIIEYNDIIYIITTHGINKLEISNSDASK